MAPLQYTRTGSAFTMWRIRSKKWQHFSTMVPPLLMEKRFQSPTFTRKGKRCSRMDSICRLPTLPAWMWLTNSETGGMKRYSIAVQKVLS